MKTDTLGQKQVAMPRTHMYLYTSLGYSTEYAWGWANTHAALLIGFTDVMAGGEGFKEAHNGEGRGGWQGANIESSPVCDISCIIKVVCIFRSDQSKLNYNY